MPSCVSALYRLAGLISQCPRFPHGAPRVFKRVAGSLQNVADTMIIGESRLREALSVRQQAFDLIPAQAHLPHATSRSQWSHSPLKRTSNVSPLRGGRVMTVDETTCTRAPTASWASRLCQGNRRDRRTGTGCDKSRRKRWLAASIASSAAFSSASPGCRPTELRFAFVN